MPSDKNDQSVHLIDLYRMNMFISF